MDTLKQENGKIYKTVIIEVDPDQYRKKILFDIEALELSITKNQELLAQNLTELAKIEGVYNFVNNEIR